MFRFLLYLLKGFCLSVMVVAIASFLVASIIFYNTNPSERTVFSSPVFIALFCGIYYPIVTPVRDKKSQIKVGNLAIYLYLYS